MARPDDSRPPAGNNATSKKRKQPPPSNSSTQAANKRQKTSHRNRQRDARTLATQTTSKVLQNGALDVDKFVSAREFEIRALESGMQRSGKAKNRRAFQQLPFELRRRTASHDVKRLPKQLRRRAAEEMIEDDPPAVKAKTRKPTRHMRLRMEKVKRLRALGAQKQAAKKKAESSDNTNTNIDRNDPSTTTASTTITRKTPIKPRTPKIKTQPSLSRPPLPKPRFRKRQISKAWLPTHLFHSKRAHVTPPSAPLWRFAIPLTPTQKSYRPTHRAAWERGAVAWDVSYFATIGLEGREDSLGCVLRGLGINVGTGGARWLDGKRVREFWVGERESGRLIAPVDVIWSVFSSADGKEVAAEEEKSKRKRKLFLRVHPSAFFQLWEEVVRLAKIAKPTVVVEDLRFEIGSIEITGPGSTEALLGTLHPSKQVDSAEYAEGSIERTWMSLRGLTNPALLPEGALLSFSVEDPRLQHPPRTITLPKTEEEYHKILELAADWPPDDKDSKFPSGPSGLFDRTARLKGAKLPSQKAIQRRKALAAPGTYPFALPTDPEIPILLYTSPPSHSASHPKRQGRASWTLLAPWRTIQPLWYGLMYYPLSTGQQPRFGGLKEKKQLAFEAGRPWFPADFPGSAAGWERVRSADSSCPDLIESSVEASAFEVNALENHSSHIRKFPRAGLTCPAHVKRMRIVRKQ